jgi:hypothetical protein
MPCRVATSDTPRLLTVINQRARECLGGASPRKVSVVPIRASSKLGCIERLQGNSTIPNFTEIF